MAAEQHSTTNTSNAKPDSLTPAELEAIHGQVCRLTIAVDVLRDLRAIIVPENGPPGLFCAMFVLQAVEKDVAAAASFLDDLWLGRDVGGEQVA
jgi:hypothetical protein